MQQLPAKIPVVEVRAIGNAHVKVLFWEYEVNFDETRTL
jgi:hypothetical protein